MVGISISSWDNVEKFHLASYKKIAIVTVLSIKNNSADFHAFCQKILNLPFRFNSEKFIEAFFYVSVIINVPQKNQIFKASLVKLA